MVFLISAVSAIKIVNPFLPSNRYSKANVGAQSSLAMFALILSLHLFLILLILNAKTSRNLQSKESSLILHLLLPELSKPVQVIQVQNFNHDVALGIIRFPEPEPIRVEINHPVIGNEQKIYELPNQHADVQQYENVFDPKMRKKLQESRHINSRPAHSTLKSWTDSSGIELVEMSEGECLKSMPQIGNSKEKYWSSFRVKCGKNQSDHMMDSVNADLMSRKK